MLHRLFNACFHTYISVSRGYCNFEAFQIYNSLLLLFSSHQPIGPQPYPVIYVVANPVRGLLDRKRSEEHQPSSNESKRKTQTHKKRQRERNRNNGIHMPEKDRRGAFDKEREFGIVPAASHPIPSPARNHAPKKRVASTTFRTLRVSVFTNGTIDVA